MQAAKQRILGIIAGLNIVNSSTFSRLRNRYFNQAANSGFNDTLSFLFEVIKITLGWRTFKNIIVEFITYNINVLENLLKEGMKSILKKKFSCSIDGRIPDTYIDNGINISSEQIDYLKILNINPTSEEGSYLYGDQNEDLNHVIYLAISDPQNWKDIITISYVNYGLVDGVQRPDVFNIKINEAYRGRLVQTFVNDFLDNTDILNPEIIINAAFDNLFGLFSNIKDIDYIKRQEELKLIYDRYINQVESNFDNSYYQFSKAEINNINNNSRSIKTNRRVLNACGGVDVIVTTQDAVNLSKAVNGANSQLIEENINTSFNVIEGQYSANTSPEAQTQNILEFFLSFFRNLIYAILNQVFSPKIMLFFSVYFKIVLGIIGFTNLKDFIEVKSELFKGILRDLILAFIVRYLTEIVAKRISELAIADKLNAQKEKAANYTLQIQSLLGINQNFI